MFNKKPLDFDLGNYKDFFPLSFIDFGIFYHFYNKAKSHFSDSILLAVVVTI